MTYRHCILSDEDRQLESLVIPRNGRLEVVKGGRIAVHGEVVGHLFGSQVREELLDLSAHVDSSSSIMHTKVSPDAVRRQKIKTHPEPLEAGSHARRGELDIRIGCPQLHNFAPPTRISFGIKIIESVQGSMAGGPLTS